MAFDAWNEAVRQLRPESRRTELVSQIAAEVQHLE
jgi:hypothetical protein